MNPVAPTCLASCPERRLLVQRLALLGLASVTQPAMAGDAPATTPGSGGAAPAVGRGKGRPGEFDWLTGEWRIVNRRRLPDGRTDEYPGEATCWHILGGLISIEELRIPARNFFGMGLRTLDLDKGLWADHWVNSQSGALGEAGLVGGFEDGVGRFDADDTLAGRPVRYRGQWDRITPTSHRWQQMTSHDGGATWEVNWAMDWTRA